MKSIPSLLPPTLAALGLAITIRAANTRSTPWWQRRRGLFYDDLDDALDQA